MFEMESKNGVDILRIGPELDARNAQHATQFMKELVEKGCLRMVADLSGLNFIDSSGLGSLVATIKMLRKNQGDLRLCGLKPAVQSVFQLTRLFKVFEVYDSVGEAVASFSSLETAGSIE